MSQFAIDTKTFVALGFDALARNNPGAARKHFTAATAMGASTADVWFGLSCAQRLEGALDEESASLGRALAIDPFHLQSLIAKGDSLARQGAVQTADSFYYAAIDAAKKLKTLSPFLKSELNRISQQVQGNTKTYESHLRASLAGYEPGEKGTERFAEALELLLGKRTLYPQRPTHFYYPGLPLVEFYEREQFPWARDLEASTGIIREELRAILDEGTGIGPYVVSDENRPAAGTLGLLNDPKWSAFYLIQNGVVCEANAARCPRTMEAIRDLPFSRMERRSPSVLFSILLPGCHIRPHHGYTNARLICHLPLIVPPDCTLRVGNRTRSWREGELFMFDDSIEHEARNGSAETRVVLLFDVWRPELSERERELTSTLLASVDSFGQAKKKTPVSADA